MALKFQCDVCQVVFDPDANTHRITLAYKGDGHMKRRGPHMTHPLPISPLDEHVYMDTCTACSDMIRKAINQLISEVRA